MKFTIEGTPKEVAALVLELREQPEKPITIAQSSIKNIESLADKLRGIELEETADFTPQPILASI